VGADHVDAGRRLISLHIAAMQGAIELSTFEPGADSPTLRILKWVPSVVAVA
jgi:hypothetical protein